MTVNRLTSRQLRLGFISLTDAAPLIVALENGMFARRGLSVALSREVGWATLRDKILYGELDAAHAPAGMLVATQLGLGSPPCDVLTACILNRNGNAITLSRALFPDRAHEPLALRDEVRRRRGDRKLTLGVVFPWSSHNVLLHDWLVRASLDPERDVRIVVVPPAQMFRNLAAGTIDGYCVGEPWNSLAVREGAGCVATWSAAQDPRHVEKVLMVRADFAAIRSDEHELLVSSIVEACAWCDNPQNHDALARLLAAPKYLNVSPEVIAPALTGRFDCGAGRIADVKDFVVFHRNDANAPTPSLAASLVQRLVAAGLIDAAAANDADLPRKIFREDIFTHAIAKTTTHEIQPA